MADDLETHFGPTIKTTNPQDPHWKVLGTALKEARTVTGLSQQALGKSLPQGRERSRAAIAQYEAGTNPPSLQTIYDLAETLGIEVKHLFGGDLPKQGLARSNEKRVPIKRGGNPDHEQAIFPLTLLAEIGATEQQLELVRLGVNGGALGGLAGDYVMIDAGCSELAADGRLYAVSTPAGAALMRAEPFVNADGSIMLTSGQNITATVQAGSLTVLGRVMATINRSL